MVQEELSRYLARSPADPSLKRELSRLRSNDQSWCVLSSTVHIIEVIRRTLASVGPDARAIGFCQ